MKAMTSNKKRIDIPGPVRVEADKDVAKDRNSSRKALAGLRSRHCTPKMHPATVVLFLFLLSCVALNIGQLVPLFASDGGQPHSLKVLLGTHRNAVGKEQSATAYKHRMDAGFDFAGNVSAKRTTRTFSRTYFGDSDEVFLCDRSNYRGDVCYLRGDVQMHGEFASIVLHTKKNSSSAGKSESIQPLTRKWEQSTMRTVENITITTSPEPSSAYKCDVHHSKPAVVFSTGGFTGNVYHDFNDILIPLFITSQHYKGEVVFVVTENRGWWWSRYVRLLKQLSKYKMINFQTDFRSHCYPEAIVGLLIHGELMIDPARMPDGETIGDFQDILARAYDVSSRLDRLKPPQQATPSDLTPSLHQNTLTAREEGGSAPGIDQTGKKKLSLVLILRRRSRVLLNQNEVAKMARQLGFEVKKIAPGWSMDLRKMYQVVHTADVVMGVHGAALTHLLFMSPGSVFIQIVPLGTDVPAAQYYGEPAVRCGLHYLQHEIAPEESSLLEKFPSNHPILTDPAAVAAEGWHKVKETYLDDQNVQPDLRKLKALLMKAERLISQGQPHKD